MPYADNQGVRIHYRVEGNGPPLVLQHGFLQSIEDWDEGGYSDALKGFRLILVDARGHGASDKPHDPAFYLLDKRASDATAVLDALGVAKAHFWGYSMGGRIGFAMAKFAPERIERLVIGGAHPYAMSQAGFRQLCEIGIKSGGGAFVAALEAALGIAAPPGWKSRLLSADFRAFHAAVGVDPAGQEDALPSMRMPCCLYAGEADQRFSQAKRAAEAIRDATFFSLPDRDHVGGFMAADVVLPRVRAFLLGR
jgi:pimeloyl-ACP methyl ester carboxylesterase